MAASARTESGFTIDSRPSGSVQYWKEYPASIFASETDADKRAAEWRKAKDADDEAALEERQRQWQENIRRSELAELKRLKEKYEGEKLEDAGA